MRVGFKQHQIRRFLWFLFGFLLFELLLQLGAFLNGGLNSFYQYQQIVKGLESAQGDTEKTIYFVGDSTVYGIGASNPLLYSLPAQLEGILQKFRPDLRVINLGYPGSCTEDHLYVLSYLPKGSTVFYRGGISDSFNLQGHYRFVVFGYIFELRSWKLFSLMFYKLLPGFNSSRGQRARQEFASLLQASHYQVYGVEYSMSMHHNIFFYTQNGYQRIPTFVTLQKLGLTDGYFMRSDFMAEGLHPNDLGYQIEAQLIFNYLCGQQLFGLLAENMVNVGIDYNFLAKQQLRYQELKKEIFALQKIPSGLWSFQEISNLRDKLRELLVLLESFISSDENNPIYQQEYIYLEKLMVLVFHSPRVVLSLFVKTQGEFFGAKKPDLLLWSRLQVFYPALCSFMHPKQKEWLIISSALEVIQPHHQFSSEKVSYLGSFIPGYVPMTPYPLELCPKFVRESALDGRLISTREEWGHFFSVPYELFMQHVPAVCLDE